MIALYIREHSGFRQAHPTEVLTQAQELVARLRTFSSPSSSRTQQTTDFIRTHIGSRDHELVGVLHLEAQHRLIALEDLHHGKLANATIHARTVVQSVMSHETSAVILFHSHPHGPANPTEADQNLFERLQAAFSVIEVPVLDYLVLADTISSLREISNT